MPLELYDIAISDLKRTRFKYFAGDWKGYEASLERTRRIIHALQSFTKGMYGPQAEEVKALSGEWILMTSLRQLKHPDKLIGTYEKAAQALGKTRSQIFTKEQAYLPPFDNIFDFYGVSLKDAPELAKHLSRALSIYGKITGGGGVGYDLLYLAEINLRLGNATQAEYLTQNALTASDGWLSAHAVRMLDKTGLKKDAM